MTTTTTTYECYFCDVVVPETDCDYCDIVCVECHKYYGCE